MMVVLCLLDVATCVCYLCRHEQKDGELTWVRVKMHLSSCGTKPFSLHTSCTVRWDVMLSQRASLEFMGARSSA